MDLLQIVLDLGLGVWVWWRTRPAPVVVSPRTIQRTLNSRERLKARVAELRARKGR